jgi:hypothetical protein
MGRVIESRILFGLFLIVVKLGMTARINFNVLNFFAKGDAALDVIELGFKFVWAMVTTY